MKLPLTLVVMLLLGACANHDFESMEQTVDSDFFWTPMVKVQKGDRKATVSLTDPRPFTDYVAPGPSNPEYFNIWISDDGEIFQLFKKVDIKTTAVDIGNLTNGNRYTIFVSAHKGDETIETKRVMTIPSKEAKTEEYLPNLNFHIETLAVSFDQNYIAYVSNNALYYQTAPTGTGNLLGSNAYGARWSKSTNRLLYIATRQEGNTIYPFELKLLNAGTQSSTTLFEIKYSEYYVQNPSFMPDGSKIAFLSSEGNKEKYSYDLWAIVPDTGEKTRLSNFGEIGFITDSRYDWSASGDAVYLEGRFDLTKPNNIYKFEPATKTMTLVIPSAWNDKTPTLSPDQMKVAFISDRSGEDEVWLYDLQNEEYKQLTGEGTYSFDSRYTNLTWLDHNHMLITIFKNDQWITATIAIE